MKTKTFVLDILNLLLALARELRSRRQHLNWCKRRALRLLNTGDAGGAFDSMLRDLGQHTETAGAQHDFACAYATRRLGDDPKSLRKFIREFA